MMADPFPSLSTINLDSRSTEDTKWGKLKEIATSVPQNVLKTKDKNNLQISQIKRMHCIQVISQQVDFWSETMQTGYCQGLGAEGAFDHKVGNLRKFWGC